MEKNKDIVLGLGEIGKPILQLLSKNQLVMGYDIDSSLMDKQFFEKHTKYNTRFLHVCIPYNDSFFNNILDSIKKFSPQGIVIHSTIKPGTTEKLQQISTIPIIYSATRGVHKRMIKDLKRYVKFFAISKNSPKEKWAISNFRMTMKKAGVKTKKMSNPITLELAKIVCDTSYYGWLITYAQISNQIASKNGVDYNEMWSFADEIHKFLKNRPKMFPGFIGGHCVIPNLKLIDDDLLNLINEINSEYAKFLK